MSWRHFLEPPASQDVKSEISMWHDHDGRRLFMPIRGPLGQTEQAWTSQLSVGHLNPLRMQESSDLEPYNPHSLEQVKSEAK